LLTATGRLAVRFLPLLEPQTRDRTNNPSKDTSAPGAYGFSLIGHAAEKQTQGAENGGEMMMNAKTAKLMALPGVLLTLCLFCLSESESIQSTSGNGKEVKVRFIDVSNGGYARDTASRPLLPDFADKIHSSKLGGQPVSVSRATRPSKATQQPVKEAYGKLPLSFEPNKGQTDARVKFLARGSGYSLFLTPQEAVLTLNRGRVSQAMGWRVAPFEHNEPAPDPPPSTPAVLRMQLVGADPASPIVGVDELPGQSHYFIGNDPQHWRTHIDHYRRVRYEGIYPGVDLVYYGNQGQLEYDFVVGRGADPRAIKLTFAGAREVRLGAEGQLVLSFGDGQIQQLKPVIYQEVQGVRKEIGGGYRMEGQAQVSFEVGRYDKTRPLVIDPMLVYSTYLGGSGDDLGGGIAVDEDGFVYVAGVTTSLNFPTTPDAFQPAFAGGDADVFVTKLNRSGTALIYSTYLGGSGFETTVSTVGFAVDKNGNAYVTGNTTSLDFPTTPGAFQTAFAGGDADAFVTKLNRNGTELIYSTYLGGSECSNTAAICFDVGFAIAVDEASNAYVTGPTDSTNFPTTPGAFQSAFAGGFSDTFVTKLNRTGTALLYSTYLGGSSFDPGRDIAVDKAGNAYVVGDTGSPDFPTTPGAFQPAFGGGDVDVFVAKLNRIGTALVYSTYLGGSGFDFTDVNGLTVDEKGNAYAAGATDSPNFPTTPGAFQTVFGAGEGDSFVTKLNRTGTALVYSTYVGGSGFDAYTGIAVDKNGSVYTTGYTNSPDFPTTLLSKILWRADIGTTIRIYGRNFDESHGARRVEQWLDARAHERHGTPGRRRQFTVRMAIMS
jgi:hypothetical protein